MPQLREDLLIGDPQKFLFQATKILFDFESPIISDNR